MTSSGIVLYIAARETTTGKRTVSDVDVMRSVGVVSVVFKHGHRKTYAEAANTVSSVVDSSAYFRNPASDVPFVEDEIFEKDLLWDLRGLRF